MDYRSLNKHWLNSWNPTPRFGCGDGKCLGIELRHWVADQRRCVAGSQSTAPLVSRVTVGPVFRPSSPCRWEEAPDHTWFRMLYVPLEIMFILQVFREMHDLGDVTSTFHTISIASSGHQFLSLICNNLWWKFLSLNNDEGFHKTVIILESVFDKSECVCESFVIS